MKRMILGAVVGSVIGGITFFPPAMPVSLTIMLNAGIDSDTTNLKIVDLVFWILPMIGIIVGGLVGSIAGKRKNSLALFKNTSLSIMFWSVFIFGVLGLETGFLFSGVTLIGLGNKSTAIDLWIFSGIVAIVGVIIGVLIGFLVVFIRLAITDRPFNSPEAH
jgi:hypothetical protein